MTDNDPGCDNTGPTSAVLLVNGAGDLVRARTLLADIASRVGLPGERVDLFIVALNEAATNAIVHGGGTATVTITADPSAVSCEIRDPGAWLTATAEPAPVGPEDLHGRGLWLARELCDDVEISTSGSGTTVRLTMRL